MTWLHRWFRYWERLIPSLYRVVAVAVGALATAAGIGAATRSRWWKQVPLAAAAWALLGKVEGDDTDRALSAPADPEFVMLVRRHVGPVVTRVGFVWNGATKGRYPDGSVEDTVLYEAERGDYASRFPHLLHDDPPELCVDLWIKLDPAERRLLSVDLDGWSVEQWLREHGHASLARPTGDLDASIRAVAAGLALMLDEPNSAASPI